MNKCRSTKFKRIARVSHADGDGQTGGSGSWWEQTLGIVGNTVNQWFSNKGKEIDANAATAAANANDNASVLAAQLEAQKQESGTRNLYIIGGVVVVLVIVVAMMFRK